MIIRSAGLFSLFLPVLLLACNSATGDELDRRIDLAARYLVDSQFESGFFRYEHDFLTGRDSSGNNLVRQAGGAFALAEYYSLKPDRQWALGSVEMALRAFEGSSVTWGDGLLVTVAGLPERAKAGATALALLSALLISGDNPSHFLRRQIDGWLNGLLALQMEDGGFESKPGSGAQSPYSNGEVWLALAHLVEQFPDNRKAQFALRRADRHFIDYYTANPDIGFFHWGVMAASKRYMSSGEPHFVEFVAAQVQDYIARLRPKVKLSSNSCYAVEGMLAGAGALGQHGGFVELQGVVLRRVKSEMDKNRPLQILQGQQRLEFGPQRYLSAPEIANHAGAFLNGRYRPQVRVDATQHCLSAMLKEQRLGLTVAQNSVD